MKRLKFLFIPLAAASIIIANFAFSKTELGHKRISKTFYYNDGANNQRLETGFTTGPVISRTIIQSTFTDINNWNDVGNSGSLYTSGDGSSFVFTITLSGWETTADGDNDGEITLSEALTAIWAEFIATGTLPSSLLVDADGNGVGVTVTITRAESTH